MIQFLAWAYKDGGSATIVAVSGVEANGTVNVPAPEGHGLHVWEGEDKGGKLVGVWRRATARDLESWKAPLSSPTATRGWCCAMRRKYLLQITGHDRTLPDPVDLADFVTSWAPQIVVMIKYCPFCGGSIGKESEVRLLA